jgi:PKHD-type hydroxylase
MHEKIEDFARLYARERGIDISAIQEPLQFLQYGPGDRTDWHIDFDERLREYHRKVTITTQLSDGHSYRGGDLEVVGEAPCIWNRAQGAALAFPSILGHRVTPVSRGTRYALVAWVHGPPYR